jgi:hypothetical protein
MAYSLSSRQERFRKAGRLDLVPEVHLKICRLFTVMPVKTGIQNPAKFLDSGSPQPEADLPGMAFD